MHRPPALGLLVLHACLAPVGLACMAQQDEGQAQDAQDSLAAEPDYSDQVAQ